MKNQSGYSKQFQLMNNWTRIVKEHKEINKNDLIFDLRITIAQYNQMKGFVEYHQSQMIEYDKPSQTWKYIGNPE